MNNNIKERINSVETCRVIAIIAVIILHAEPFRYGCEENEIYKQYAFIIFNQLSRFAVPFYFIISGFFWGKKTKIKQVKKHTIGSLKRFFFCLLFGL